MPDVWSRGPEVDDTQDGEVLVAQALETQAQAGMILDIDTGQPHASVKVVVVSSTDVQDVQTVEATADENGRAKIQFERDVDTGYVITLTVNGQAYTMTDKESTCDRLEIVAPVFHHPRRGAVYDTGCCPKRCARDTTYPSHTRYPR